MSQTPAIDALIPHRGRMRLIDTILSADADQAVVQATVGADWPLTTPQGALPILLVELAAQAAGISLGWSQTLQPEAARGPSGGWLVGIKRADFSIDHIPVGTCITIHSRNRMALDQYREIGATARIGEASIGEIQLQVLQAGQTGFSDLIP